MAVKRFTPEEHLETAEDLLASATALHTSGGNPTEVSALTQFAAVHAAIANAQLARYIQGKR